MGERERFVLRMCLLYCLSNLDDVNEAFAEDGLPEGNVTVNGDIGQAPVEEELEFLMRTLQ